MALVRIIASIRPAVTNKFFSIEACRSSSAMSSLFIKSGGYRYHQHTSPRISGIAPVTALLFSFGTNYLLSTECTPNEPDEKRHLCNSAATMLFHSRKQSLTIGAAMKAAGYSKQECESEMHQKRVQRQRIKLEELNGNTILVRAANILLNAGDPSFTTRHAMDAAGYSEEECASKALRKRVQRARDKLMENNANRPLTALYIDTTAGTSTLSILTGDSSVSNGDGDLSTTPKRVAMEMSTASSNLMIDSAISSAAASIEVPKRRRRTSRRLLQDNEAKIMSEKTKENAFVIASKLWREESKKKKGARLSCYNITKQVNAIYGTSISEKSVRRHCHASDEINSIPRIGRGRKSELLPEIESALRTAMLTYIELSDAEMNKKPNRKTIVQLLGRCLTVGGCSLKRYDLLYERLVKKLSDKLQIDNKNSKMEQRRLEWTTFNNLNIWFDNLNKFLIDFGFARAATEQDRLRGVKGELVYLESQTHRIMNLDESEVSTDGTSKLSGGRPVTELSSSDKSLPKGANTSNKSGYSATFIGGSTISGWPLPPHIQVKSEAKDENKKISMDFFSNMMNIRGRWGFGEVVQRGITFGANAKAGMDNIEFEKYLMESIVPLYPDALDIPGKRVCIIVDSGPGRMQEKMLATLRLKGFYLIAGVPNTTHVTQATDRNYGLFKSIYRVNLGKLTEYVVQKKEENAKRSPVDRVETKTTIKPTDIPLLIFGGLVGGDDKTNIGLRNAFEEAFGFEANEKVWEAIGIRPFDRKCLQDDKVKHEIVLLEDGTIDIDADPLTEKLIAIERANKEAVDFLTKCGYDGEQFRKSAPVIEIAKLKIAVTVPLTREHQDLLSKASTGGDRFRATGGGHIATDDMFISIERKRRVEEVAKLSEKKKKWEASEKREREAKTVIEKLKTDKSKDAYKEGDAKSLTLPQLKILYRWKYGKMPQAGAESNKPALLNAWQRTKDNDASISTWTPEEEVELTRLQSEEIQLKDTEIGRQAHGFVHDTISAAHLMSKEDLLAVVPIEKAKVLKENLITAFPST